MSQLTFSKELVSRRQRLTREQPKKNSGRLSISLNSRSETSRMGGFLTGKLRGGRGSQDLCEWSKLRCLRQARRGARKTGSVPRPGRDDPEQRRRRPFALRGKSFLLRGPWFPCRR